MTTTKQSNRLGFIRPDPDSCLPQRCPAWRWNTAIYVNDPNCGNPPNSDDPWVQAVAEFMERRSQDCAEGTGELTATDLVIAQVCALPIGNKVAVAILEARLLADETIDEIVQRSGIPAQVVEAYEQLFFNVTNEICKDNICFNLVRPDRLLLNLIQKSDLGHYLQMVARTSGVEGVELVADVLGQLNGKTFADGLPAEDTKESLQERARRMTVIQGLGLFKPQQLKKFKSLLEAIANAARTGQEVPKATLVQWDQLLSQVRVPQGIREYAKTVKPSTAAKIAA